MKVTITIENDSGRATNIIIDQAIVGGNITRHWLEKGDTMTVQTSAWPLKIMDDLGGRF